MLPDTHRATPLKEKRDGPNLADARLGRATLDEVVTRTDVSDLKRRKRAFEDLEHAEEKLRHVIDTIPTLAWCNLPDGTNEFLNKKWHEYTGFSPEESHGCGWQAAFHPEDLPALMEKWKGMLVSGQPGEIEARLRRHDGAYRWFLIRAEPFRDEAGKILRWYGTSTDIDDRKQAENKLRQGEFYLAEGQRLAHAGSWSFKPDLTCDYWSGELYEILSFDPKNGIPSISDYLTRVHPGDREIVEATIQRMVAAGEGCDVKKRIIRPDGVQRVIRCVGMPVLENGVVTRFVGTLMDITEQEELTQELRRSKAHLADAQKLSRTGSVGMDVSTKRIFWSEESARIYGYPPETEPTPDLILQRVHPDDVDLLRHVLERAARGGTDFNFEHRLLMPDGSIKHIYNLSHTLRDEVGNEEIVGAIVDITQHKVAEEAIRRSEAYLAEAQRLSHTGSFGWNPVTGEIVWSDETYRIFEYEHTEKPALDMVLQRAHPADRALAQEVIQRATTVGTDFEHEYRLLMPSGTIKHIHVRAHALHDSSGKIEFVGAVTDITERKTAEEQIREQEMELRQILDLAPQLVVVFGPNRERLYINRMALDYLGVSLDEWQRSVPSEIHPDDLQRLEPISERASASGSAYELEVRVRKGDGTYRWFLARYNPVLDDKGKVRRWYVACTDIEERKHAEERTRNENLALREQIDRNSMFEDMVGSSDALRKVLRQVAKVAPSDSTVLILGETGTGKELVARAIHRRSSRSERAFIGVNCAAIPPSLIASELFGHEKGAFTGATQRRLGRFESANSGTIFLDEVGDLPMEIQIAMLRVLQEREIERVGSNRAIPVDVRVLAATHRDLDALVVEGKFRQDLLYRLRVVPIQVPSLRERADDIPMLVDYFVGRFGKKAAKKFRTIDKRTVELFEAYPWPGNVRELQNVIERAVILSEGDMFYVDETWFKPQAPQLVGPTVALNGALQRQEKEMIEAALAESGGRVSGPYGAATRLGLPRPTLEARIKRLGINKYRFKVQRSS
jgi:PAS domain S-box-containing protein